jgi:anti-sigma regulatory factor (Ser/Thr protein kinase)
MSRRRGAGRGRSRRGAESGRPGIGAERTVFTVKNRLSELERAGRLLAEFGARHHVPVETTFACDLALGEVLANVISYAYDDGREHEIEVRLSVTGGQVVLEVEDDGRPFDPLAVPPPRLDAPLAERPVGGLGLHLVRSVMDGVEHHRRHGRNLLVLRKAMGPPHT